MIDPLNKLCKWRTVLAGWHAGTKSIEAGGAKAMRDLMDKWLIMRAEASAFADLLIEKGVFTAEEFTAKVHSEAQLLDAQLEQVPAHAPPPDRPGAKTPSRSLGHHARPHESPPAGLAGNEIGVETMSKEFNDCAKNLNSAEHWPAAGGMAPVSNKGEAFVSIALSALNAAIENAREKANDVRNSIRDHEEKREHLINELSRATDEITGLKLTLQRLTREENDLAQHHPYYRLDRAAKS